MTFQASAYVNEVKTAFSNANDDVAKIKSGIELCNKRINSLNRFLRPGLSTGTKQRIVTCIANIKSYRANFEEKSPAVEWEDLETAFKSRIKTVVINNRKHKDIAAFLDDASIIFKQRVEQILKDHEALKINTVLCGEFVNKKENTEIVELKYFNTRNAPVHPNTNVAKWFTKRVREGIPKNLEEFEEGPSGWTLSRIMKLTININKLVLLSGSSYIDLPEFIKRKKACVNVKNDDQDCFVWAVLSAIHPAPKNSGRTRSYSRYRQELNLKNIDMPMKLFQISRFEKQNDISINVFEVKKEDIRPCYLTKYGKKNRLAKYGMKKVHVNLLLIEGNYDENSDAPVNEHYVWIKNLSRLLSIQLSRHNGQKFICNRCLIFFNSKDSLDTHSEDCGELNQLKVIMPKGAEKYIKFKHIDRKLQVPFVIYADIECILKSCADKNKTQEHVPSSVGYYVQCSYDESLCFYDSRRNEDCMQWFVKQLYQFAKVVQNVFLSGRPMDKLTSTEELQYNKAVLCHICKKSFDDKNKKVRDHCHLTGKYRGPAHQDCNTRYKDSRVVPVVFHNLSHYDSHFIIKNLATGFEGALKILPVNKETYIAFTKHVHGNIIQFRFIDSFRFMSSSLDKLASNLKTHPILKSQFQNCSAEKFELLKRKGVYPYDYSDSVERFDETKLPKRQKFYSSLNDAGVSEDDYAHAKRVWKLFEIKNLGEYSDLYLKTNVLLLADVFEQFRKTLLSSHELDPAHYYSAPGYTWDAMLKYTGVKLELLTNIDMLMFIERGVRGGLSQCSKRYVKANNKYMTDYDPNQTSNYLVYTDVNNLYGYALSKCLPYGGFQWEHPELIEYIQSVPDDNPVGYILEVDLEYPPDVHSYHSDLPFCPEHRTAPISTSKEEKLMATLFKKERYVIHYITLKHALANGLKLIKTHRILKFNQRAWLKPYIDLNTDKRTKSENDFEKDLYKLLNNAVFGKTMENVRNYKNVKLKTKWEGRYGAGRLISKPQFKSCNIIDENLVVIEMSKAEVFFNKPIYVGMSVLDISKTKLYEFHYGYMKSKFGDKCEVCYTDTDSLIYNIECDDIYEVIRNDCKERFDTSDYPENNRYGIPRVNKKVPGMMTDELNGKIMTEFVGLRSKCYAYRVDGEDKDKKAKGIKKHITKNKIIFDDYVECLRNCKPKILSQNVIISKKHSVFTSTQTKIALSHNDDKRYLMPDSYDTLAWGHCDIMETENVA